MTIQESFSRARRVSLVDFFSCNIGGGERREKGDRFLLLQCYINIGTSAGEGAPCLCFLSCKKIYLTYFY